MCTCIVILCIPCSQCWILVTPLSSCCSTSNSVLNRYSFYADPRYHDYHRSTQSNYYPPNDYNSNIHSSISAHPPPKTEQQKTETGPRSPYINRTDGYNSLPKQRDWPVQPQTSHNNYVAIPTNQENGSRAKGHRRYPSYDSASPSHHPKANGTHTRKEVILDYDDPRSADNSVYARVRKPPLGNAVSNPARV